MSNNDQSQTSSNMVSRLKNIFATNETPSANVASQSNAKTDHETYHAWGVRWSGNASGNTLALSPALQSCYTQNVNEQNANQQLQAQAQTRIQDQIDKERCKQDNKRIELQAKQDDKQRIDNSINEFKNEIDEIKRGDKKNTMSKVNFYIGLVITLLLALYLFIFYSSASFSAFFGNEDITQAGAAILDSHCFAKAINNGIGQLLFILLMPVIFLGLGFLIHQFGESEKGVVKYVKIGMLYFVTFIFDALLAFEISETVYNNTVLSPIAYTVSMAFNSPSFWIVIFSGFVAYVIWGLVFDFTLQHLDNMNEHTREISVLEDKISNAKKKKTEIDSECSTIQKEINQCSTEISRLENQLNGSALIDNNQLKRALSDFFSGWMSYLNLADKPASDKDDASRIYNQFVSQIK